MTIKVLLICENPDENKRKMWSATYDGTVYHDGNLYVVVRWGRIDAGRDKSVDYIIRNANQGQSQQISGDEAALAFIDKKVKEKVSKGYQMVVYEHDGLPMTFLCDKQPDEHGRIKMQTWSGKN